MNKEKRLLLCWCSPIYTHVWILLPWRIGHGLMRTSSKWRIELIKKESEEMATSWNAVSSRQIQFYQTALFQTTTVLPVLLCVTYWVFSTSHCQYLTIQLSQVLLLRHTTWVLLEVINFNITATSDQSLQEDGSVLFILSFLYFVFFKHDNSSMLEIMDRCSQFLSENEAVYKCWYCKYTGSVFFSLLF